MQHRRDDDQLDLSDYLRILRRRWAVVLAGLALVVAAATAFTVRQTPKYCTTAQVLLSDSEAQEVIRGDGNVSAASRDLLNEINIALSDSVRTEVIAQLGVEPEVEIEGEQDSDILWFHGCGPTAADSALYSNTWATVYVEAKRQQAAASIGSAVDGFQGRLAELREQRQQVRQPLDRLEDRLVSASTDTARASLQAQIDRMQSDLEVELELIDAQIGTIASTITQLELDSELASTGTASLIQAAAEPLGPDNAPLSRNLILGSIIGLLVGAGLAIMVDNFDRSLKTPDDIRGLPVLGAIPRPGKDLARTELGLATMNHTGSGIAEGYQKVRTSLEFAMLGKEITSLLITSPDQDDGKTTTSANLAWAMSAIDHRVVLVDVDFRRPKIHKIFGCPPEPGLSDNLLHGTPLNQLALRVDDQRGNLVMIPTGAQPPSPGDFVASPAFSGLLRNLEKESDLVILDSSPVLPVSDALSIARQVDAVIVVAMAGKTSKSQLSKTVDDLRAVGADVLGVCLVGIKADTSNYRYDRDDNRNRREDISQMAKSSQQAAQGTVANGASFGTDVASQNPVAGPNS